jgi:hypothetical protein
MELNREGPEAPSVWCRNIIEIGATRPKVRQWILARTFLVSRISKLARTTFLSGRLILDMWVRMD